MKKLFGEIDLTWKKLIILAIAVGVSVGLINSVPLLKDTSFTDPAIYFDFWILLGILIIMNSKNNKDSALKCFVFFLISQPLIYLVEVPFSHLGWQLFTYYKFWFVWTILCLPMGYVGYYIKKDKWWGLLILLPMLFLIGRESSIYLNNIIFSFPRHILSYLFSLASLIIYPLVLFNNIKLKRIGLIISILIIIAFAIKPLLSRPIYETEVLCSGEDYTFDDTYNAYLTDSKYGEVSITIIPSIESYCVHAKFTSNGDTKLILESNTGTKRIFDLHIERETYEINEIKNKDNEMNLKVTINEKEYILDLEDNETTKAFVNLLPQEFNMNELNGNEKYVYMNQSLPNNNVNPEYINAGDVMLYGDNCLVIFYKSFATSYSYTKIGHITNLPDLGNDNIVVKITP